MSFNYKKIVVGVAPYTRAWAGVKDNGLDKENPGLYASANPNSVKSAEPAHTANVNGVGTSPYNIILLAKLI